MPFACSKGGGYLDFDYKKKLPLKMQMAELLGINDTDFCRKALMYDCLKNLEEKKNGRIEVDCSGQYQDRRAQV